MQFTTLGRSDLRVSRVALGCMSLAVTDGPTYKANGEAASIATVHAALDAGINFFDTAPAYQAGEADRLLGQALEGRRDRAVIATKASGPKLDAAEMTAELEQSLKHLRTDHVDLLQIHWPRRVTPIDETMRTLESFRTSGKVRALGVCNFGPLDLGELLASHQVVSDQVPYSLLFRAAESELTPICTKHGVGLLCYSPLAQGLLAGKFKSVDEVPVERQRTRHFSAARPQARHGQPGAEDETFAALRAIAAVCDELGRPMAEVAVAWLLHQPAVACVLTGASRPEQIRTNAADLKLDAATLAKLSAATDALRRALGPGLDPWQAAGRVR